MCAKNKGKLIRDVSENWQAKLATHNVGYSWTDARPAGKGTGGRYFKFRLGRGDFVMKAPGEKLKVPRRNGRPLNECAALHVPTGAYKAFGCEKRLQAVCHAKLPCMPATGTVFKLQTKGKQRMVLFSDAPQCDKTPGCKPDSASVISSVVNDIGDGVKEQSLTWSGTFPDGFMAMAAINNIKFNFDAGSTVFIWTVLGIDIPVPIVPSVDPNDKYFVLGCWDGVSIDPVIVAQFTTSEPDMILCYP